MSRKFNRTFNKSNNLGKIGNRENKRSKRFARHTAYFEGLKCHERVEKAWANLSLEHKLEICSIVNQIDLFFIHQKLEK